MVEVHLNSILRGIPQLAGRSDFSITSIRTIDIDLTAPVAEES